MVLGEDFVFVGPDSELQWVQQQMEVSFLVKIIGKLGGDDDDLKEI